MNFIDKKKVNIYVVTALLFLSYGFAQWQSARGILAYLSTQYSILGQAAWLFNDIVAVLLAGIVPTVFYEIVTAFAAKYISMRGGKTAYDMKYALRFFFIAANIVIGALKFLYYLTPLVSVFFGVVADFIITTAFFVAFLAYCAKHYVPNVSWGIMCMSTGGVYLVVQTVIVAANLLSAVIS